VRQQHADPIKPSEASYGVAMRSANADPGLTPASRWNGVREAVRKSKI
jgi:hypothetical protein